MVFIRSVKRAAIVPYFLYFFFLLTGSLCVQIMCTCEHTKTFGGDSTALQRVDGPVVVLESVHQLQDSADPADGGVDGGGADELR